MIATSGDHDARTFVQRKSANPCAERGKRDGLEPVRIGERQRIARRAFDELRRRLQILPHDRGVNHEPRLQLSAACDDAFAGLNGPLRHRLALYLLAAARLDRARNAGTHPERSVGRVDDRVGRFGGDVTVEDVECDWWNSE